MWIEDMLLPGNFQQYRQLAEATSLPLIAEERRGATRSLKCWNRAPSSTSCLTCAGAEGFPRRARSLAMADSYQLPIAPHTAGGPLLFYASTHLSTASMNVWIQESCQRFYEHDWPVMLVWHHPAAVVEAAQVS